MKKTPTSIIAGLWIALLSVTSAHSSGSWFDPTRVQTDRGTGYSPSFNLKLMNDAYTCADSFSNVSASTSGNRITLTYQEIKDTGIVICPLILMDYGPTFRLPPLWAGYYEVYAEVFTCSPSAPLCELPAPVYVGFLSVYGDVSWTMRPDTVDANTPFDLEILNGAYGNCFVGYPNARADVIAGGSGDRIDFEYAAEYYPARNCLVDLHPAGPRFAMRGLPVGNYPVTAWERPLCVYDSIPCRPQVQLTTLVDTLVVRQAAAIMPRRQVRLRMRGAYPLGIIRGWKVDGRKASASGGAPGREMRP